MQNVVCACGTTQRGLGGDILWRPCFPGGHVPLRWWPLEVRPWSTPEQAQDSALWVEALLLGAPQDNLAV